jgi:hypothetical protein
MRQRILCFVNEAMEEPEEGDMEQRPLWWSKSFKEDEWTEGASKYTLRTMTR